MHRQHCPCRQRHELVHARTRHVAGRVAVSAKGVVGLLVVLVVLGLGLGLGWVVLVKGVHCCSTTTSTATPTSAAVDIVVVSGGGGVVGVCWRWLQGEDGLTVQAHSQ